MGREMKWKNKLFARPVCTRSLSFISALRLIHNYHVKGNGNYSPWDAISIRHLALSLSLFETCHLSSLITRRTCATPSRKSTTVDSKVKLIYPDWLAKRVRKVKDTISPISSFYNSFRLLIVTQVTICFDSNFLSCARNFVESYERKKKEKDHH